MVAIRTVSLDSNAWEDVFSAVRSDLEPIRNALILGHLSGFICDAAFRIEAIVKKQRGPYFAHPKTSITPAPYKPGYLSLGSFGPDDLLHPGLPDSQLEKLKVAAGFGVKLMRGRNWIGLPSPSLSPSLSYCEETLDERAHRERIQLVASEAIEKRDVGYSVFRSLGGWSGQATTSGAFSRACAEWADGELVAAHIAYRNDLLCTSDFSGSSQHSIFDAGNRAWLEREYATKFMSLVELKRFCLSKV